MSLAAVKTPAMPDISTAGLESGLQHIRRYRCENPMNSPKHTGTADDPIEETSVRRTLCANPCGSAEIYIARNPVSYDRRRRYTRASPPRPSRARAEGSGIWLSVRALTVPAGVEGSANQDRADRLIRQGEGGAQVVYRAQAAVGPGDRAEVRHPVVSAGRRQIKTYGERPRAGVAVRSVRAPSGPRADPHVEFAAGSDRRSSPGLVPRLP